MGIAKDRIVVLQGDVVVNAENISAIAAGDTFAGPRKPRFAGLRRLARALGFGPPEKPQRPAVRHPLDRLVFHNFAIYELYRGQPGRQYMSLADAQIVKKMSLRELETGHCEYRFEMNGPVDAVWLGFFKRIMPDFPVRFENRTMALVCFPQDLESTYDQIRDAVAMANVWHAEEREALLLRITAHDESQLAMREMEENRKQGLRRQFDGLEL